MDHAVTMPLSLKMLDSLPGHVLRPVYARSDLSAGLLHIGLGNFHRAHQAWYLHRLMQSGKALDWAVVGAGVRPADADMRARMLEQDCLTTLVELSPDGTRHEVTGAMIDYVPVEPANASLVARMTESDIRIVSMTVTEGGYFRNAEGSDLDLDHPDIRHDVVHPYAPRTAFGAMVAALRQRKDQGLKPFTALCCDNLQGNGDILRQTVLGLAGASDPGLADWIAAEGAFPNSMVDCIVPATGPELIDATHAAGINDAAPVSHENFRQWVIEDRFSDGRPPLEEVGVTLTDNVHAYETMKIRILNGGHQLLANAAEILNVPTIADCMTDPQIGAFFEKVARQEILPSVSAVPEMTPATYLGLIKLRFANPAIRDTTRRVAFDGSARHLGFLLPSLRDAIARGGSIEGLALAEALWARMCEGSREDGSMIEANDPHWATLQPAAKAARRDPGAWLGQAAYYGDLADHPAFSQAFGRWLSLIWEKGTRHALETYLHR